MPYRTLVCGERPCSPGFPGGADVKESACQCRRHRFDPWVGNIPWRRKWKLTPVFLPGKFHGRRATVHRVTKSWTQLSTHTCTCIWGLQPQPLSPLLAGWCLMSVKPLKACWSPTRKSTSWCKGTEWVDFWSRQHPFMDSSTDFTTAADGLRSLWLVRQWLSFSPEYQLEGDISRGCKKYNFTKVA